MSRRPGNPFTMAEKKRILRYIIDWQAQYKVKGNAVWMQMEPAFNGKHTWQSLKEHYKKKIYPNLASPDFELTEEQIRTLRRGSRPSIATKKNKQQGSPTSSTFYELWSDEEASQSVDSSENRVAESAPTTSKDGEGEEVSAETQKVVDETNATKVSPRVTTGVASGTWVLCRKPIVTYSDSSSGDEEDGCATGDSQTLCAPNKSLDLDETIVDSDEWEDASAFL